MRKVSKEIKTYTEEDLLKKGDLRVKEIFFELKKAITSFGDDIRLKVTKSHVGFLRHETFAGVHIKKSTLYVHFKTKNSSLDDPEKKARLGIHDGKEAPIT